MIFEVAHHMALLPLLWLGVMSAAGIRRGAEWWWLASVFLVSWLTDTAAHMMAPPDRWVMMIAYPVSQAALVALVMLTRRDALRLLAVLLVVGVVAVLWRGVSGPDVLLRTVAWGSIAGIVLDRWALGRLRVALLVSFGLGLVTWYGYAFLPGWTSWLIYQGVRAVGIGLFCWASLRPVSLTIHTKGQ